MLLKIYYQLCQEIINIFLLSFLSLNILINIFYNLKKLNILLLILVLVIGICNIFIFKNIYYSNILSTFFIILIMNLLINNFYIKDKIFYLYKKIDKEFFYILSFYLILTIFKNNSYLINPMNNFMQYLDYNILSNDFIKSVINQHSSPPFLTILYGFLSKFGLLNSVILYIISIVILYINFIIIRKIAEIILINKYYLYLIFLYPSVLFYSFWSYQPIWGFTFINIFIYGFLSNNYRFQVVGLSLLSLTHVIFHPFLVISYTLFLLFKNKICFKYFLIALIPLFFLLKNIIIFNTYSLSSWSGCNIAQMIPANEPFNQAIIKDYIIDNNLNIQTHDNDVLYSLHKLNNEYNYNHIHMISYCKNEGKKAIKYILQKPIEYARSVRESISERGILNSVSYEGFHEYFINKYLNNLMINFLDFSNGLLMLLFNILIPIFILLKVNLKIRFLILITLFHALITHMTNGFEQQRMTFQFLIVYQISFIYFIKYFYDRFFVKIIRNSRN